MANTQFMSTQYMPIRGLECSNIFGLGATSVLNFHGGLGAIFGEVGVGNRG